MCDHPKFKEIISILEKEKIYEIHNLIQKMQYINDKVVNISESGKGNSSYKLLRSSLSILHEPNIKLEPEEMP